MRSIMETNRNQSNRKNGPIPNKLQVNRNNEQIPQEEFGPDFNEKQTSEHNKRPKSERTAWN